MHPLRSFVLAGAASALLLAVSCPVAHAQSDGDRATARSLGVEGQHALDKKDYTTAEDHFRRAESLVHAPTLMLGLARSLAGLGRYVEAQETYNRILREGVSAGAPDAFKKALADANREVDGVGQKVGGVTISVHAKTGADVPSARVVLDGATVNTASLGVRRAIDPGSHVVVVSADGFKPAEVRFDVTPGGSVDQPVDLEPDPNATANAPASGAPSPGPALAPEQPASSHGGSVLPWVAFGLGAVGLGIGGVAGYIAMGQHSDLAGKCLDTTCTYPGASSDLDSYHTTATVSTVAFIAGGVGVVAGVILLVAQPKGDLTAGVDHPPRTAFHVTPVLGLGSFGAVGEF